MFNVKLVTTEEEKQLAFNVRKKVFVEEQGVPVHLELDEFDETAKHFIVQDGEKTIAAARAREVSPGIGKVERVCVLKDYRGKRLGILIMEHVEKDAIQYGWTTLKLNAQSYAVPFYEKLGYVVTSPEFLDAYIPHRAMEKNI
ncbi:GNAT family N-acetyltransferase [Lysinibacillus sp. LZ02]|uniref:GNAT family N-acetyltransferase n=1 Tax=Lysinibacillus sp. LZ02 TaxID=3420668 RepID=UPI003D36C55E